MLITCQFCVSDARQFSRAFDLVLDAPHWPDPLAGKEFQRCFGIVKKRRRGGMELFEDEIYYSTASRAVRFHRLEAQWVGESEHGFKPLGGSRRLFSDGVTTTRVEVSIRNASLGWAYPVHGFRGIHLTRLVLDFLDLPVKVMRYRADPVACSLGQAGPHLQDLFCSATTREHYTPACSYLSNADPIILIEFNPEEVQELPSVATVMDSETVGGARLAFLRINDGSREVGVWLLDRESSHYRKIRRLKMGLSRLHAEHQALKWVLHLSGERRPRIPTEGRASDFRWYLERNVSLLGLRSRGGFSPVAIADILEAYSKLLGETDRALLERRLERLAPAVYGKIVGVGGGGGSIQVEEAVRVFVCYSHEDESDWKELLKFLEGLKREKLHFWWDQALDPGVEWDREIRLNLKRADIAILLVSRYFLNSPYIRDVELKSLLSRERSRVRLFPIKLGPCDLGEVEELRELQVWPTRDENIREHFSEWGRRENLYNCIYEKLKEFGREILEQRSFGRGE